MDDRAYEKYMEESFVKYDSACRRCGECCGVNNDPCTNLVSCGNGKYACCVYNKRLGPQKTISGKSFNCVSIKDNIRRGFCNPNCAYVNGTL